MAGNEKTARFSSQRWIKHALLHSGYEGISGTSLPLLDLDKL